MKTHQPPEQAISLKAIFACVAVTIGAAALLSPSSPDQDHYCTTRADENAPIGVKTMASARIINEETQKTLYAFKNLTPQIDGTFNGIALGDKNIRTQYIRANPMQKTCEIAFEFEEDYSQTFEIK